MPDRWKQYAIDPAEIAASADAAVVSHALARGCAEDASDALLRTLGERATPFMRSSTKAQQATFAAAIAAIFRDVAARYETTFRAIGFDQPDTASG